MVNNRFFVSKPLKIYFYGLSSLLRYDSNENYFKNNKSIVELNNFYFPGLELYDGGER